MRHRLEGGTCKVACSFRYVLLSSQGLYHAFLISPQLDIPLEAAKRLQRLSAQEAGLRAGRHSVACQGHFCAFIVPDSFKAERAFKH